MCHCLSSGKTECFCHCLGKGQRGAACFWGECRRVRLLGRDIAEGPLSHAAPMITARMPHFAGPAVGAVSRQLSFKQFDNGTVLIGGGAKGARASVNRMRTGFEACMQDNLHAGQSAGYQPRREYGPWLPCLWLFSPWFPAGPHYRKSDGRPGAPTLSRP